MRLPLIFSLLLSSVQSFSIGNRDGQQAPVERDLICYPDYPIVKIYISTTIVTYPVFINTYIAANTIININGGVVININNAPTQLSTTVTATVTSTITSTVTAAETETALVTETATPLPLPAPFIILVTPLVPVAKRQIGGTFISGGGSTTDDCKAATVFSISNGQLKSGGEVLSTGFNTTSKPFAVSPIIGSISTVFSVAGAELEWKNGFFYNGQASYCSLNGTVEALFSIGAAPEGCLPVSLSTLSLSSCFGATIPTTPTTPSNTTLPTSTSAPSTFLLQASNAGIAGQYAEVFSLNDTSSSSIITFDPSIGNASIFSLDAAGHLLGPNGTVGNQDPINEDGVFYPLYLNPPAVFATYSNYTLPVCSLAAGTGQLECAEVDGRNLLQYCPEFEILFLDKTIYENCTAVDLFAIDAAPAVKVKRNLNLRGPIRLPWINSLRRFRH